MIICGSIYLELYPLKYREIIFELLNAVKCIQSPLRGFWIRYFLFKSLKNILPIKTGEYIYNEDYFFIYRNMSLFFLMTILEEMTLCAMRTKREIFIDNKKMDEKQRTNMISCIEEVIEEISNMKGLDHNIFVNKILPKIFDIIERVEDGNDYYMVGKFYNSFDEDVLSVFSPINSNFRVQGYVVMHYSIENIERSRDSLMNIYYLALGIMFVLSLLVLLVFTLAVYRPLKKITRATEEYADGNLTHTIEVTKDDEIGHLQNRFHKMQRSLQEQVNELEQETAELHHDSDILRASFGKTEEADRMRTSFLHYMTNQMALPSESIDRSVTTLCNNYQDIAKDEIEKEVTNIERKSETIVELLNHMAHFTEMEDGKEADHE